MTRPAGTGMKKAHETGPLHIPLFSASTTWAFVLSVSLGGCGTDARDDCDDPRACAGGVAATPENTKAVETWSDLPPCDADGEGAVYFVDEDDIYARCSDGNYVEVTVAPTDDPTNPGTDSGGATTGGTANGSGGAPSGGTTNGGTGGTPEDGSGGTSTGGTAMGGTSTGGAATGGQTGSGGSLDDPYDPTEDGYFRWLGALPDRPSDPSLGDALYWEEEGSLCVWDGASWILLFSEEPAADCKAWEDDVETTPLPSGTRDVLQLTTAVDGLGNAFVAWSGQSVEAFGPQHSYVIRKELGDDWATPFTLGQEAAEWAAVIADGQGNALVTYSDSSAFPPTRKALEFSGDSFKAPETLENIGGSTGTLNVSYTSDGEAVTAWTSPNPGAEIVLARRSVEGSWSPPVSLGAGVDGGYPFSPTIATGPDGQLCVLWVNTLTGGWDVYAALYDPDSGWEEPVRVYEAEDVVRYQQGAYDDDGNLLVVFSDEIGATQPVFSSFRPAGGAFSTPELLSSPSEESWEIDLTTTGQGEWVVVWEAKNGVSARTTADGTTFGTIQEWIGPFANPQVVALGEANALVVFGQVREVVGVRYAGASGWLTRQTLGATTGFDSFSLAANEKGDALVAWSLVDGFNTLFYR